jgi:protein gp37
MGKITGISWTDHTFNPWWGCVRVSPGCQNCYAERDSKRWGLDIWGPLAPRRFFGDRHWNEPLAWSRAAEREGVRRRVFCGSMCDVFEDRPDLGDHRLRLYRLIEQTPMLDWLLLTKRPENVMDFIPELYKHGGWPSSVWIGATAESQEWADRRVPILLSIPAPVRFLSCEPLLGPIDLSKLGTYWLGSASASRGMNDGIDWVIAGGESGPNASPMHPAWARSLRDQCQAAGAQFFFKQWGEWSPELGGLTDYGKRRLLDRGFGRIANGYFAFDDGTLVEKVGRRLAGDLLDGKTWHQFPGDSK